MKLLPFNAGQYFVESGGREIPLSSTIATNFLHSTCVVADRLSHEKGRLSEFKPLVLQAEIFGSLDWIGYCTELPRSNLHFLE